MDSATAPSPDDSAALEQRRERLRAFAQKILARTESLTQPKTHLEADRAARNLTVADKVTVRLHSDTPEAAQPTRLRLRALGDILLDTLDRLPEPDSFLECERAGRLTLSTDRMLVQFYGVPAPKTRKAKSEAPPQPDMPKPGEAEAECRDGLAQIMKRINKMTREHARSIGYWPDGSCFNATDDPAVTFAECDADIRDLFGAPEPYIDLYLMAELITARVNAVTRAEATIVGHWRDQRPYHAEDADFYTISDQFEATVIDGIEPDDDSDDNPTKDPLIPPGFPWWLVRAPQDTG